MYEELYESIPDAGAYLARLRLQPPVRADKEYLDQLIYAHQRYIVFENLDSYVYRKPVSLAIRDLYEKIIVGGRGGFCFELNALLTQLLRDLGYRAYGCMARILRNKDFIPPVLHRGILIELGERLYFCDVGYGGPMPPGAVAVESGAVLDVRGEYYWMERADAVWWTVSRRTSAGREEKVIQFYTVPQREVNFIPLCGYCANSPDSVFTQKLFLNRRTSGGSVNILGNVFTRVEHGMETRVEIGSRREMAHIIRNEFELELPAAPL